MLTFHAQMSIVCKLALGGRTARISGRIHKQNTVPRRRSAATPTSHTCNIDNWVSFAWSGMLRSLSLCHELGVGKASPRGGIKHHLELWGLQAPIEAVGEIHEYLSNHATDYRDSLTDG